MEMWKAPVLFTLSLPPRVTLTLSLYHSMVGWGVPLALQLIAVELDDAIMMSEGWAVNCGEVPDKDVVYTRSKH